MNSVTLYALGKRDRSYRVQWLLAELGMEFQLVWLDGPNNEHKSAPYLGINPFGTVPAIAVDGIKMFDSGAIIAYLLERDSTHSLAPAREDTAARAEFWQWFFFGATTLDPAVFRFIGEKLGAPNRRGWPRRKHSLNGCWSHSMATCGKDEPCWRTLHRGGHHGRLLSRQSRRHLPLGRYSGMAAYLDRLKERPAARVYFEAIAESIPQA